MIGRVNFHCFGLNTSLSFSSRCTGALIFLMLLSISNALDYSLFHGSKSQAVIILILEMKKLMPGGRLQLLWGPPGTQGEDYLLCFSQVHFQLVFSNPLSCLTSA